MNHPKVRLLYVIENEFFGGGERAFAQLIKGLDKSRYEVYAACLTGELNPASAAFAGEIAGSAEIITLDLRRLVNPFVILRLKNIIKDNNIRIVHSQGPRADFYCRLAARAAGGARVVSTVASPVEEYNVGIFRKAAYSALDRFGAAGVDRYVAVADHIARKLNARRGIPLEKIRRIYNGVDVETYSVSPETAVKAKADYDIPPGCFLAAAVSRLSWEKGLLNFVDAAGRIAAEGRVPAGRIKYIIAGAGPLEQKLTADIEQRGLTASVILAGFLGDVRPLLGAADVLVQPSYREGFPVSVLEGMAAGKPVIASDIEGIAESVTDGLTGLLVPQGDSSALAGAITDLFENKTLAGEMGMKGREIVKEKFSLRRMIKDHEELYREILKQ